MEFRGKIPLIFMFLFFTFSSFILLYPYADSSTVTDDVRN